MAPTATGAAPGAHPGAVSVLVHEQLTALAQHHDDAAEQLDALRRRLVQAGGVHATWSGPGSLAFAARLGDHERELAAELEKCRETARSVRWAATVLAERIAGPETAAQLGLPLRSVLSSLLGPGTVAAGVGGDAAVPEFAG